MSVGDQALEFEREIDLRRWRDALLAYRWVVIAGLVVGLLIGGVYSRTGGDTYQATVTIEPGQPYNPHGSAVLSYTTSPLAIERIVASKVGLAYAAAAARMPVDQLRGHATATVVSIATGPTITRGTALIQVTVSLPNARTAEAASNAFGRYILKVTEGPYVATSLSIYALKELTLTRRLNSVTIAISNFDDVLAAPRITAFQKLEIVGELDDAISRQGSIENNLIANQSTQALAQNIELSQIVNPAAVSKPAPPSLRNSLIFGGLIGLTIACILALLIGLRKQPHRPRANLATSAV